MRFVTIKDIARALDLSVSTVSRALNDDNNIRQETRQKVLATAKQMGYMKSPVAMNLKFGYTKTIGVIVPEMTTPYASLVIDGIQNVCYANHYKVVIASSGEDAEKERQSIEIMYQFMVDGIIACRTDNRQNHDLYQSILDRKMPLVLYDRLSPDLVVWANGMSYSDGGVAIDRLLGKSIDAVFAFTDTLAIGAMNRLTSMGRRVPEDIAVAGFSGTIISSIVNPQLTTVEPPQYAIGQTAARLVLDLINGKQPEKKEVTLDAEIIYRKSTE